MIVDNIVFCSIFVKIQIGPHSVVAIYTSLSHERKIWILRYFHLEINLIQS